MKSHPTHAVERGKSVEVAWILLGTCVGFARNFFFNYYFFLIHNLFQITQKITSLSENIMLCLINV